MAKITLWWADPTLAMQGSSRHYGVAWGRWRTGHGGQTCPHQTSAQVEAAGDRLASMADAIAETVKIASAQLDANSVTGGYGSGF